MARSFDARRIALSLPEASEQDHFGRPSFRVRGKIFATLWAPDQMNVMLDMSGILDAVDANPETCSEFWWGKRVRAVQVDLRLANAALIRMLLEQAWRRKAPRHCSYRRKTRKGRRPCRPSLTHCAEAGTPPCGTMTVDLAHGLARPAAGQRTH